MRSAIFVVVVVEMFASPVRPATHPLLGEHNAVTLDSSASTLSTSNETLRKAILQAVQAASTADSLLPLKVDYPLDEAVFPPDIAAPTFVWSDPAVKADTWLINVVSSDAGEHLHVLTQGATLPRARDDDPRTLSEAAAAYEPPEPVVQPRRWMPSPDVWEQIKNLSHGQAATVTITGFQSTDFERGLSSGRFKFSTSDDAVGAPIFYRDVPLMPGARGKRDIDGTLTYTVPASLAQVRFFYRREMVNLGWRSTSEVTTDDEAFTMMVFEKDDANVGVSISVLGQDLSYVTLGLY